MTSGDTASDPVAVAWPPAGTVTLSREESKGLVRCIGGIARLASHVLSLVCFIMAFHREYQRDMQK